MVLRVIHFVGFISSFSQIGFPGKRQRLACRAFITEASWDLQFWKGGKRNRVEQREKWSCEAALHQPQLIPVGALGDPSVPESFSGGILSCQWKRWSWSSLKLWQVLPTLYWPGTGCGLLLPERIGCQGLSSSSTPAEWEVLNFWEGLGSTSSSFVAEFQWWI